MFYGSKCWAVKKQQIQKVCVVEMRILRWIYRVIRKDKKKKTFILEQLGIASIYHKMREHRLRWYEHVFMRPLDAIIRRSENN